VAGVSAAVLEGGDRWGAGGECITSMAAGLSNRGISSPMKGSTWLQQASLSKTIGAAYMVSYYQARGVPLDTPVTSVLKRLESLIVLEVSQAMPSLLTPALSLHLLLLSTSLLLISFFYVKVGPGCPQSWIGELTLSHLVNHTGLGMHYVYGAPPSRAKGMPTPRELLQGDCKES